MGNAGDRSAWAVLVPSENEDREPKLRLGGSEAPFMSFSRCWGMGWR